MIQTMKITQEHQDKLESLFTENSKLFSDINNLSEFVAASKRDMEKTTVKVKCPATWTFSQLCHFDAMNFICDEIYKYADDSHLRTFYKKLYKKYS